jgi:hypothetical protein
MAATVELAKYVLLYKSLQNDILKSSILQKTHEKMLTISSNKGNAN